MKVAIYVRVSTDKQELSNQREPLKVFVSNRKDELVEIYEDVATGSKSDRDGFNAMIRDAYQGKFEAVVVWAIDRLTREGMIQTMNLIDQLGNRGIGIISYTEPYLDTTSELARNILLAVVSTLAKAERLKISERTKAGLARLRARGHKFGRPTIKPAIRARVQEELRAGQGVCMIARLLKVSPAYVSGLKNRVQKTDPENLVGPIDGNEKIESGLPGTSDL